MSFTTTKSDASVAAVGFFVFLLVIAYILGSLALYATVIVANVNDMLAQGYASFWPIFWILLTGAILGGVPSAISSATK